MGLTVGLLQQTPALPTLHLVDKSSSGEKEMAPLKRRRVEVSNVVTTVATPESDVVLGVESARFLVAETVLPPEVAVEGIPSEAAEVAMEERAVKGREVISSSTEGKRKIVVVDDDGSGSDIDPEEVQTFDEGFIWVEVRIERSTQNIIIPLDYNLLTNSESMVPSLIPLYAGAKNRTLQIFKDDDLSLCIFVMSPRVSFLSF